MKTLFGWTTIVVLSLLAVAHLGVLGLFAVPIIASLVMIMLY